MWNAMTLLLGVLSEYCKTCNELDLWLGVQCGSEKLVKGLEDDHKFLEVN
jgi:hypothetical protein